MFEKKFGIKFFEVKASIAILSIACAGLAGGAMAESQTVPRTNATWYNTYAEDAIANAAKRDRVVVIRERELYLPYRHSGHKREKFFKRHKKGQHIDGITTVRPNNRGVAYNPRAALLRSGISR